MLKNSAIIAMHHLIRAVILAGFAFYIVHLVRSGNLNLYIAAKMQFIVKLSALGMYAVAAQQIYAAIRAGMDGNTEASCGCHHEMPRTWGKSVLLYGWFVFPLVLGFSLPDEMLGSSMAAAKGVQFAPQQSVKGALPPVSAAPSAATSASEPGAPAATGAGAGGLEPEATGAAGSEAESAAGSAASGAAGAESATSGSPSAAPDAAEPQAAVPSDAAASPPSDEALREESAGDDELFPVEPFTESYAAFGKKLVKQDVIVVTDKQFLETLTTLDLFRTAFIGKTVQISGFVYREDGMSPQQFGASRFAISCCSADASPYGVMINYGRASAFETDQWVTVTGKLGTTQYNDIEIIQIEAVKIVKITPPDDPYVSPDLDFGMD